MGFRKRFLTRTVVCIKFINVVHNFCDIWFIDDAILFLKYITLEYDLFYKPKGISSKFSRKRISNHVLNLVGLDLLEVRSRVSLLKKNCCRTIENFSFSSSEYSIVKAIHFVSPLQSFQWLTILRYIILYYVRRNISCANGHNIWWTGGMVWKTDTWKLLLNISSWQNFAAIRRV